MRKSERHRRRPGAKVEKFAPHPDDIVAVFAANLKAARLKAALTQAEFAERAGLKQQYVSLIESGKQNATLRTAQKLADVVQLHVTDLLNVPSTRVARR